MIWFVIAALDNKTFYANGLLDFKGQFIIVSTFFIL